MKFIKQLDIIKVKNFDTKIKENKKHGALFPNSIRGIIVGPSNCGKTNVMLSILLDPNGLKFENLYIYSKSLHQPKYAYLRKLIKSINGMEYNEFSNNCEIITPSEAKRNSIFIFDDVACDKQNNIREYFCMGRHNDVDSFYLCQSYTHIPKHLIRDNANYIVIFKQDELNLKHIYNDHINSDMSFNQFRELCSQCWKDAYGFLVVNKDCSIDKGRYNKSFKDIVTL